MARFRAGWNMPGYLPETDPVSFDDFDEAREFISDELDRAADDLFSAGGEGPIVDAYNEGIDEVEAWRAGDFGLVPGGEWVTSEIENYVYWISEEQYPGQYDDDEDELF
ncbi:MAG: hypothetical protein GTN49_10795 [candidate division Zixibacteria bacterium]|nr:hypothetical protein [candidate division Zixibacteria bacterium]